MAERLFVRLPGDPVYAPETTVPAGTMRELALPRELRGYLAHATFYEEHIPDGREVVEHVLPDGAARLIVDLHGSTAIRVVGASAEPVVLRQRGHLRGFSVALQAGAAAALLDAPAHAIAGQDVSLADLWGREGRDFAEQLAAARDDAARGALILSALRARCAASGAADAETISPVRRAVDLMNQHGGRCSMAALTHATGLGERRLQQLFREHLGLAPRTWMRLARMHHCLRMLRAQRLPWAHLAAEAGYADQSHLANEFRALSGLTPSQFLRMAGSAGTAG
jgi:AraC-like DNA-binding protein